MTYSIGTFSELTGLSIDTLRYYEKEGIICPGRDTNNRRVYTEADQIWINFIIKLKETAMPIKKIKEYACLRYRGDETVDERLNILYSHRLFMLDQKKKLEENIEHLNRKIAAYEKESARSEALKC
ncbi:MerR family transcriptional regulator [Sporolactobacillus pectinivorans]|uniref:MerR family transcriptional regulator n=1 Tax=Sporolactobacillus pectinivorans TaxID=1591408 RepID=UPI000C269194|nr:MerR family transcriptional regulator [Sporolactobacillus pectinivorans]